MPVIPCKIVQPWYRSNQKSTAKGLYATSAIPTSRTFGTSWPSVRSSAANTRSILRQANPPASNARQRNLRKLVKNQLFLDPSCFRYRSHTFRVFAFRFQAVSRVAGPNAASNHRNLSPFYIPNGSHHTLRFREALRHPVSLQRLQVGHQIVNVRVSILGEQLGVRLGRRFDRVIHLSRRP